MTSASLIMFNNYALSLHGLLTYKWSTTLMWIANLYWEYVTPPKYMALAQMPFRQRSISVSCICTTFANCFVQKCFDEAPAVDAVLQIQMRPDLRCRVVWIRYLAEHRYPSIPTVHTIGDYSDSCIICMWRCMWRTKTYFRSYLNAFILFRYVEGVLELD